MSVEDDLRVIFSTYPEGIYTIDTIEISHSLFSQIYRFTREPLGIKVNTETENDIFFEGANFEPELGASRSDLDRVLSFTIPDIDNVLDDELDNIPIDNKEPIKCIYRVYNSDDFSAPSFGPLSLDVVDVSQQKGRFTILASLSLLNWNTTGLRYDYTFFPALRALV